MFTIKLILAEEAQELRHKLLRPHRPYQEVIYKTDYQAQSFHVGAFCDDELVSIASFCLDALPSIADKNQYRLRSMATIPSKRKLGYGREVVNFAVDILHERKVSILWCKGRTSVKAYYERLGFVQYSSIYDYPTLGPHVDMVKTIKGEQPES